jgi:hypothetical protein
LVDGLTDIITSVEHKVQENVQDSPYL